MSLTSIDKKIQYDYVFAFLLIIEFNEKQIKEVHQINNQKKENQ